MKKIFLASNNEAKVERFKNLIKNSGLEVEIYTPKDFGLEKNQPEENGKTLAENAEIKARAYLGKVDMPIISNDTGFYVEGEGLIDAPKRMALGNVHEEHLTKEQIAESILTFWKGIAKKYGGKVDAAWVEEFVLLNPDGEMRTAESRREVILTDTESGNSHIQFAIRTLCISKITGKYTSEHTVEEEIFEMKPVTDALVSLMQ